MENNFKHNKFNLQVYLDVLSDDSIAFCCNIFSSREKLQQHIRHLISETESAKDLHIKVDELAQECVRNILSRVKSLDISKSDQITALICANVTRNSIDYLQAFLRDLDLEMQELIQFFDLQNTIIRRITYTGSDSHNFGKQVLIVEFLDTRKILYKPRKAKLELLLQDKLKVDWIPNTLAKNEHHWVEYIEAISADAFQVNKFSLTQLGSILASAQFFGIHDLHDENVMLTGFGFMLIDAEAFGSNLVGDSLLGSLDVDNYALDSVIGCGGLYAPFLLEGNDAFICRVLDHHHGFSSQELSYIRAGYRLFQGDVKKLKVPSTMVSRYVIRNTSFYGELLNYLLSGDQTIKEKKDALHSLGEISKHIDPQSAKKITNIETFSLLNGDIPYFAKSCSDPNYIACEGFANFKLPLNQSTSLFSSNWNEIKKKEALNLELVRVTSELYVNFNSTDSMVLEGNVHGKIPTQIRMSSSHFSASEYYD